MLNDCLKVWIMKTLSQNIYLWKIMYTVEGPWLIKVFVSISFTSSQASSGNCLALAVHVERLVGLWPCVRVSDKIPSQKLWVRNCTCILSFLTSSSSAGFYWAPIRVYTQEMLVWSLGHEDPLEKDMATHSSVLAWRIPWTEEPGGLQSMGLQRVGHDWFMTEHTYTWSL